MLYNKLNLEVAKFASKSEARPEIAGVLIKADRVVATDSFRLVEMTTPKGVDAKDYPKVNGKSAMRGCKPFIVPAKELSKIKIPVSKALPVFNHIAIGHIDDTKVEFLTTNLEQSEVKVLRRIKGKYPDYEKIFPAGEAKAEISVNGEFLAEICNTLSKLDNIKAVKIKFYNNGLPLVLTAGNDQQSARAMLMPLRD